MESKTTSSGGIGLLGGVFLVFLILKLAEIGAVAKWSWWWVASPIWIPIILSLGVFMLIGIGWGCLKLYNSTIGKNKYRKALKEISERTERNKKPISSWERKLEELKQRHE